MTQLSADQRAFLDAARRGVLVTRRRSGLPRPVPVCYAVSADALVTAVDSKPKQITDPMRLGRVRDIQRDPRVVILVDRWDEAWDRLAWLRIDGVADIIGSGDELPGEVDLLRARYPQYREDDLATAPIIRVRPVRVVAWGDVHGDRPEERVEGSG